MTSIADGEAERATRSGRSARGAGTGRTIVAVVILALAALVVLVRFPRDVSGHLRVLMTEGPAAGQWRHQTLDGVTSWVVAEHPDHPACVHVARVGEDGRTGRPAVQLRERAARFFVPGAPRLFFANYRPAERGASAEGAPDLLRATWVPRHTYGGETARILWVDEASGRVVRLEDLSLEGHTIRRLDWLGEAEALPAPAEPAARACAPRGPRPPPSLGLLAAKTPFVLLRPAYLPPGFELLRAGERQMTLTLPVDPEAEEAVPRRHVVRLAYLDYSDGLATLALGVAVPEDMDAFEQAQAGRPHDPDACPALPALTDPRREGTLYIRRRRDRCRTALRVDLPQGVSVSLIGCNELPEDEYVRVIKSLVPVEPSPR